mmetsp:Transcript_27520/g.46571  ORF Transcript_27520/g.46571 Transcript_27520/m.46571 type:complete len:658 (-) Transcript_27520:75-2048(-)
MVEHNQPPSASEPSSPSSMDRLLILAAVSQRAQREQTGTSPPEEEESSVSLVSNDSTCIDLTAAANAASKNTAIRDGTQLICKGAVDFPPKKRSSLLSEATNTALADPTTFTLNENEDIMVQLHRNGLDQVKIPPLHGSEEPLPPAPVSHNMKRKVSEGNRGAMTHGGHLHTPSGALSKSRPQANNGREGSEGFLPKIVTGGTSPRSNRQRRIVMPPSSSFSTLPAPPLGRNGNGYQDNIVVGGGAPSTQIGGHDNHKQIMSMSMNGLSSPNLMLLMQRQQRARGRLNGLLCGTVAGEDGPNPQMQSQKRQKKVLLKDQGTLKNPKKDAPSWSSMPSAGFSAPNPNRMFYNMTSGGPQQMQHRQKAKMQTLIVLDEDEGPTKKKRKKKDTNSRAATAQGAPKCNTTKDGKPIVFPNQDIYSQMLQMKTLKSSPQEAEALAAQIAPFYSRWRKDEASSMAAAAPSSSQWNPSFSVQTTGEKSMHQHQEDPLKIQSRFLEMEMSLTREHQQKQLQKYILEQQNRQRRTKDVSLEQLMAPKLMMQQQHHHQPIGNNHLSLPPMSIPMAQQDPTLLPQNNAHLQVVLRELENQVRAEEHDRILQSNQRRAVELRCHQAVLLEEQMKLREMEIMRERNRLVDLQTVNRLRLQADVLENQLMM